MNVKELEHEVEIVDVITEKVARADDTKTLYGLIARGIWQVALQLGKLYEGVENTK